MPDIVWAIIAFVAFSLITDAIEGKKKKRRQQELPPKGRTETKAKKKKNQEIVIPPIQHAPPKYERQSAYGAGSVKAPPSAHALYSAAGRNVPQEAAIVVDSNYDEAKLLKPADIHWNVLLSAVAYTQILQPPKAYQYMATKSCRGEWKNDK